jgi:hypothetical protein
MYTDRSWVVADEAGIYNGRFEYNSFVKNKQQLNGSKIYIETVCGGER